MFLRQFRSPVVLGHSGLGREGEDVVGCETVRAGREPTILIDRYLDALSMGCQPLRHSSGERGTGLGPQDPGMLQEDEDGVGRG
jgi:hypothetical protein